MCRRRLVTALFFVAPLVSCSSSSKTPAALEDDVASHPGGAGPMVPLPPTTSPAFTTKIGGTVGVSPGTQVGYALTATAPMTYQLRWTGDAKVVADGFKEFYGSIWTTGKFTALTPGCDDTCPLENGDVVSPIGTVAGGQRIDWDTFASTGWDGFTFQTDTEPVYFDVFVDGKRRPDLFVFSAPDGTTTSPDASPFSVSSLP